MKARSRLKARKRKVLYAKLKKVRSVGVVLLILVIFSGGYAPLLDFAAYNSNPVAEAGERESSNPPDEVQTSSVREFPEVEKSIMIANAVEEFLPEHRSEALMIMHCLAHRENGHGASDAHGDNGKAGGPFQFWEKTWVRMRKHMMKDEHTDEIGSRYDFNESARTTAYAISKGWSYEWGPIYRASQGSNFATCQVPSWY